MGRQSPMVLADWCRLTITALPFASASSLSAPLPVLCILSRRLMYRNCAPADDAVTGLRTAIFQVWSSSTKPSSRTSTCKRVGVWLAALLVVVFFFPQPRCEPEKSCRSQSLSIRTRQQCPDGEVAEGIIVVRALFPTQRSARTR